MLVESFSGIRGIYGEDIDQDVVKRYMASFVQWINKEKPLVVVGMDTRPSSLEIKNLMVAELISQNCDVLDVGYNTTPAVQLAMREYKADGGIMITASHNEPEWNGWKFLCPKGNVLEPKDIDPVIENSKTAVPNKNGEGSVTDKSEELSKKYIDFVLDTVGEKGISLIKEKKMKVVVDPNGGTAAIVIKELLEKLGAVVIEKNMELGKFNHLVEPNRKSLAYLSEVVKEEKADLGAGWDCDGDRVELIDDKGTMLSGQYILSFLVDEVLSGYEDKDAVVVTNDATSGVVKEIAAKHGASVTEVEVGEVNVVKKMDEVNSPVGGEGSSSGGIFPPSRCRDGVQATAMIMRLMARTGKKLSEFYDEYPKYYTPRVNVECGDKDVAVIRENIAKKFEEEGYKIQTTGDSTGGLKIIIDETSWIWYRTSKTENGVFRIITDSKSEDKSEKLLKKGEEMFNQVVKEL